MWHYSWRPWNERYVADSVAPTLGHEYPGIELGILDHRPACFIDRSLCKRGGGLPTPFRAFFADGKYEKQKQSRKHVLDPIKIEQPTPQNGSPNSISAKL